MGEKAKMFLLTGPGVIQQLPFIHSCLVACLRSVPICLFASSHRGGEKQANNQRQELVSVPEFPTRNQLRPVFIFLQCVPGYSFCRKKM